MATEIKERNLVEEAEKLAEEKEKETFWDKIIDFLAKVVVFFRRLFNPSYGYPDVILDPVSPVNTEKNIKTDDDKEDENKSKEEEKQELSQEQDLSPTEKKEVVVDIVSLDDINLSEFEGSQNQEILKNETVESEQDIEKSENEVGNTNSTVQSNVSDKGLDNVMEDNAEDVDINNHKETLNEEYADDTIQGNIQDAVLKNAEETVEDNNVNKTVPNDNEENLVETQSPTQEEVLTSSSGEKQLPDFKLDESNPKASVLNYIKEIVGDIPTSLLMDKNKIDLNFSTKENEVFIEIAKNGNIMQIVADIDFADEKEKQLFLTACGLAKLVNIIPVLFTSDLFDKIYNSAEEREMRAMLQEKIATDTTVDKIEDFIKTVCTLSGIETGDVKNVRVDENSKEIYVYCHDVPLSKNTDESKTYIINIVEGTIKKDVTISNYDAITFDNNTVDVNPNDLNNEPKNIANIMNFIKNNEIFVYTYFGYPEFDEEIKETEEYGLDYENYEDYEDFDEEDEFDNHKKISPLKQTINDKRKNNFERQEKLNGGSCFNVNKETDDHDDFETI